MSKGIFTGMIIALIFMSTACEGGKVEESLKKDFPKLKFESVKESEVNGLYEVVTGGRILYYYPKKGYIVVGPIITKESDGNVNLTEERMRQLSSAKAKDIPVSKGIKIGSGKNVVIEFTDPDCPYCRKMSDYLKTRDDLTRYVFMFPLTNIHPKAEAKSRYVLCSSDQAKALEEVMSGKFDSKDPEECKDKKGAEKLEEQINIATQLGINGTPAFYVNGNFVSGADTKKFESFLKK
ncbi:MAG: DsbC family protein [Nitrospirae bacterium]|nr:DsbC family protein [Nitrospirota bacterium]